MQQAKAARGERDLDGRVTRHRSIDTSTWIVKSSLESLEHPDCARTKPRVARRKVRDEETADRGGVGVERRISSLRLIVHDVPLVERAPVGPGEPLVESFGERPDQLIEARPEGKALSTRRPGRRGANGIPAVSGLVLL